MDYNNGWSQLIIRWVNCLKITKEPIKELSELKNYNLLRCLIEKKSFSSSYRPSDTNIFIKEFLKQHYSSFEAAENPTLPDIVELTSLLMHYFCIKIKDDHIMRAMVDHLSMDDQIDTMRYVKCLITESNVSNQTIKEAIWSVVRNSQSLQSPHSNHYFSPDEFSCSPATFTSLSASSPIVPSRLTYADYTPMSVEKSRSRGRRKKTIKLLEADLETERFDKNQLQEEINKLNKKIEDLEKAKSEHVFTICRLRSELEAKSDCDVNDDGTNDVIEYQNRLRKEISSLESELSKAMEENSNLHEERENLLKQVQSTDQNLQHWKSKALHLEQNEERIKNQLENKHAECADLKALVLDLQNNLEEYRPHHLMNASIECDDDSIVKRSFTSPTMTSPGESLKGVVEVQLKEQILRNETLMENINTLKCEKKDFEIIREDYKKQLQSYESHVNELKIQIKNLNQELSNFNKCKIDLHERSSELKREIESKIKISDDNVQLQRKIENLQSELNTLNQSTFELSQENENYKVNLLNHTMAITNQEKELSDKLNTIEQLNNQLAQLQNVRNSIEIKFNESEAQAKQKINILEREIQTREEILDNQRDIHDSEILNKVNEINFLNQEIHLMTAEMREVKANSQQMENEMKNKQNLISQLYKDIDRLTQDNSEYKITVSQFQERSDDLNRSNKKIIAEFNDLVEKIPSKDALIEKNAKEIKELMEEISNLKLERDDFQKAAVVYEETIQSSKDTIDELKRSLKDKENVIVETEARLTEKVHEFNNLKEEYDELSNNLRQLLESSNIKIEELENSAVTAQTTISEKEKHISELRTSVTEHEESSKKQFEVINLLQKELDNTVSILTQKNEDIVSRDTNILEITERNDELNEQITELRNVIVKLQTEIQVEKDAAETVTSEKNVLEENNKVLQENLRQMEIEIQHLNDQVFKYENLLSDNDKSIKELSQKVTVLTEQLKCENEKYLESKERLDSLCNQNASLAEELTVTMSQKSIMSDKFTKKIQELEDDIIASKTLHAQCENEILILKEEKDGHLVQINTLHLEIEEIQTQMENKESSIGELNIAISELKSEISRNNIVFDESNENRKHLENDIIALKNLQVECEVQIVAKDNLIQNLKNDKDSLLQEIDALNVDLKNNNYEKEEIQSQMEKQESDYETQVSKLKSVISKREKEVQALKNLQSECRIEIEELIQAFNKEKEEKTLDQETEISKLKSVIDENNMKINNFEDLLHNSEISIQVLNDAKLTLQAQIDTLRLEYEELQSKMQGQEMNLKENELEVSTLKSAVTEKNEEIDELKEKVKIQIKCTSKAEERIDLLDSEKNTLLTQIDTLKLDIENNKNENELIQSELKSAVSEKSEEIKELKDSVEMQIECKIKMEELIVEFNKEKNVLFTQIDALKLSQADYKSQISELRSTLSEKYANYNECVEKLTDKDLHILQLESDIKTAKERVDVLIAENYGLKTSIDEVTKCLLVKEDVISSLTEKIHSEEVISNELSQETERLRVQLALNDKTLEDVVEFVNKIMSQYQQNITDESFSEDHASLEYLDQHDGLKKPSPVTGDSSSLKDKLVKLHNSFESITKTCAHTILQKDYLIENIKTESAAQLIKLESLEATVWDYESKMIELQKDRDVLTTEATLLSEINSTLEKSLENSKQTERQFKDILMKSIEAFTQVDESNSNFSSTDDVKLLLEQFANCTLITISRLIEDSNNLRDKFMLSAACDDTKLGVLNSTIRENDVSSTTPPHSDAMRTFALQSEEASLILKNVIDVNRSNRQKVQQLKTMFRKMQNKILNTSTHENTLVDALSTINEWDEKINQMEQSVEDINDKFYLWINENIQNESEKTEIKSDLQTISSQTQSLKDLLNNTQVILKNIEETQAQQGADDENIESQSNYTLYSVLKERCSIKQKVAALAAENEHLNDKNAELISRICSLREILQGMEAKHMDIINNLKTTRETELEKSAHKALKSENAELREKINLLEIAHEKNLAEVKKKSASGDVNLLINEMRLEYEDKLTRMKQKMKQLYQEEINKYTEKNKKQMRDMDDVCQEYKDKIQNYEQHVNQLSSQLWKVGEKLLMEKNEKEFFKKQVRERSSSQQSLNSITSVKSLPQTNNSNSRHRLPEYANHKPPRPSLNKKDDFKVPLPSTGLHVSDEEGEIFDNTYLTAMKMGKWECEPRANSTSINVNNSLMQPNRLSELQFRNSLCLPHLKSSYPVEMQFIKHKEEDVKMGVDNLNDTIVAEKPRNKKEVGQTTYKKPGPPTPSKHGGRHSLQGNEREPLKEHNDNVTKKTTPSRIKSLFMGNSSKSNTRDENTPNGTPKSRRLSIFRSQR